MPSPTRIGDIATFCFSTIITIAHRLNTILDYDRIMVLQEGKILELDTPAALIEKEGGLFKSMCQVGILGCVMITKIRK